MVLPLSPKYCWAIHCRPVLPVRKPLRSNRREGALSLKCANPAFASRWVAPRRHSALWLSMKITFSCFGESTLETLFDTTRNTGWGARWRLF